MADIYRLRQTRAIINGEFSDKYDVFDAGGFKELEFYYYLSDNNFTAGKIHIQHSSVNEEATFEDVYGGDKDLTTLPTGYHGLLTTDHFARFIRWKVVGAAPSPNGPMWIDVVAKVA